MKISVIDQSQRETISFQVPVFSRFKCLEKMEEEIFHSATGEDEYLHSLIISSFS